MLLRALALCPAPGSMRIRRTSAKYLVAAILLMLPGTVQAGPSNVSVTPSSGSGTTHTFSYQWSGIALSSTYMLINSSLNWPASCYTYYSWSSNQLWLLNDAGNYWGNPVTPGTGGGGLSNSQCALTASAVSGSATNLTVTLTLTFASSFAGAKNFYMNAYDSSLGWGVWEVKGAWTVPAPGNHSPSNISVTPLSGSGSNQIFAFAFSDPDGFADLSTVYMLVNSVLNWPGACYAYYARASNSLYLLSDDATLWLGPVTPAGAGILSNSQCTLSAGSSTVSSSGTNLTVNVSLAFKNAFEGDKNLYMNAQDNSGAWSNWQGKGTWTVPPSSLFTNLTDFGNCIGQYGTATTCVLAPGRYQVQTTMHIGRSNFTIAGGGGPGDTILWRGPPLDPSASCLVTPTTTILNCLAFMMFADSGTNVPGSAVTIQNLTFDGNRYGFGLGTSGQISCLPGNAGLWDLNLTSGGKFIVQGLDFINAPGTALQLSGVYSSVSFSNFGQGGYGRGSDGTLYQSPGLQEPRKQSATRSTAVWIDGSSNGAWYNAIAYAGTAAITLNGSGQYAYGNLLQQNRYELSDGSQGGSLSLNPGSSNAYVAGNVINGNFWSTNPGTPLDTGCLPPQSLGTQSPSGIEAYGLGHGFYNNEIEQHSGSGMSFAGSATTGRITISSQNPSDPSDTPRYIEMNKFKGIHFLGFDNFGGGPTCQRGYYPDLTGACQPIITAVGVTLYNVNVRNNTPFDVDLDGVINDSTIGYYGPYNGFLNSSCIIVPAMPWPAGYIGPVAGIDSQTPPNEVNVFPYGSGMYNNTLSSQVPSNAATGYGVLTTSGGTCPDPGWPAQTPAPSHNPSWHW